MLPDHAKNTVMHLRERNPMDEVSMLEERPIVMSKSSMWISYSSLLGGISISMYN